jgi:DNA-binding CsgD family transcriptional regulator
MAVVADPRVSVWTPEGMSIRQREIQTCVRMRREGYTFAEIARAIQRDESHVRVFVRRAAPKLMPDGRAWQAIRRARIVASQEHDACGPQTYLTRVKAVIDAQRAGELSVLIGSLEDSAAASLAWANRLAEQRDAGILRPPIRLVTSG